jgi:thiamine-phosphate pyrophosphorylase
VIENPLKRLEDARLYLICDGIEETRLDAALRGGVDIVEIMDSDASDAEVLAMAARLRPICERHGVPLMLNNRPGLVAQAGADGVHVDARDLDVAEARATLGPERILGTSAHTPAEIDIAQALPVDYISIGPVHATPTRPNRPAAGHALVTYASRNSRLPFFAVGGIEPHNTGAVAAAGASRIAVVRAITQATNPERSAEVLRSEIEAPVDFLERYRARTEASNAAARAKLKPLAPGERPWPLKLAAGLAALAGVVNLIAYAAGDKVNGSHLSGGEIGAFALVAFILAAGMWQRNGLAVLAFMAVLAIIVLLFSLFLIEASNVLGVLVPLVFIGVSGSLFWKLIRILGRIQAPQQASLTGSNAASR